LRTARVAALLNGEFEIAHYPSVARVEGVNHAASSDALEVFADSRSEFQPMAVRVDHWMSQPRANRRGIGSMTARHRKKTSLPGPQHAVRERTISYRDLVW
jgi:hypothetical protein